MLLKDLIIEYIENDNYQEIKEKLDNNKHIIWTFHVTDWNFIENKLLFECCAIKYLLEKLILPRLNISKDFVQEIGFRHNYNLYKLTDMTFVDDITNSEILYLEHFFSKKINVRQEMKFKDIIKERIKSSSINDLRYILECYSFCKYPELLELMEERLSVDDDRYYHATDNFLANLTPKLFDKYKSERNERYIENIVKRTIMTGNFCLMEHIMNLYKYRRFIIEVESVKEENLLDVTIDNIKTINQRCSLNIEFLEILMKAYLKNDTYKKLFLIPEELSWLLDHVIDEVIFNLTDKEFIIFTDKYYLSKQRFLKGSITNSRYKLTKIISNDFDSLFHDIIDNVLLKDDVKTFKKLMQNQQKYEENILIKTMEYDSLKIYKEIQKEINIEKDLIKLAGPNIISDYYLTNNEPLDITIPKDDYYYLLIYIENEKIENVLKNFFNFSNKLLIEYFFETRNDFTFQEFIDKTNFIENYIEYKCPELIFEFLNKITSSDFLLIVNNYCVISIQELIHPKAHYLDANFYCLSNDNNFDKKELCDAAYEMYFKRMNRIKSA